MGVPLEGRAFESFHGAVHEYLEVSRLTKTEPAFVFMAMGAVQSLAEQGKVELQNVDLRQSLDRKRHIVQTRESIYDFVRLNPVAWVEDKRTVQMAGGIVPTVFGDKHDPLWQEIVAHSKNEVFSFAGISLPIADMAMVGEFARFLIGRGPFKKKGACVDERLVVGGRHSQIHCDCGACAAIGKSIGNSFLEDDLHLRLDGKHPKQPIIEGMTHHASTTIYTDLGTNTRILKPELRALLQLHHALPFHASVPVEMLMRFASQKKLSDEQIQRLVHSWCQLNIQIPRNIIGGHNELSDLHEETSHVINMVGVPHNEIEMLVLDQIRAVPHAIIVFLEDAA